MSSQSLYYTPSGKTPALGSVLSLAGGILAAIIGGVVYAAAVWFLPFAYLNFIICGALAMAVGFGAGLGGKFGHLRSPFLVGVIALFCGLLAMYIQWVAYLTFVLGKQASYTELFTTILVDPAGVWQVMMKISVRGIWSVKSFRPSGLMLQAFWAAEALIIVLGAAFFSRSPVQEPYSESCGQWMEEETLSPPIAYVAASDSFRSALERGDHSPLLQAELPAGDSYAVIKIHSCQGDTNAYCSVVNTEVTKKGKKEETSNTDVVEYLRVPLTFVQELRAHLSQLHGTERPRPAE